MPRFRANHLEELPAGELVSIDDRTYMRTTEPGVLVELATGWTGHWCRLTLHDEMVTSVPRSEVFITRTVDHHPV